MSAALTDTDVAEHFGITVDKLRRLVKSEGWPHMRLGKSYRFSAVHVAAIEALLEVKPAESTPAETWGVKTRGGAK
jgi:excisionase family DNA binding protein